jgi:predicted nucleotidyltransferase
MLDKKEVLDMARQYAKAVTDEFSPAAIILYGSYVYGTPTDDSDIDVAVVFESFTGDWYATSTRLWRLTRSISFLIEPVLLDSAADQSGFVGHVYKHGEIIYRSA